MIVQNQPVVLVYYSFRGMAHVVRTFLKYLQVPFYDVHLDLIDSQTQTVPAEIISRVKNIEIDKNRLPLLLHGTHEIWGPFEVNEYLCIRFNKEELLGKNMQQRAIVEQIFDLYRVMMAERMEECFLEIEDINEFPEDQFLERLEKSFLKIFFQIDPSSQIQRYINFNETPSSFILGNLTLPDFEFQDNAYYVLGIFGALCPQLCQNHWKDKPRNYRASAKTVDALLKLKAFYDHFHSQPWCQQHQESLRKYPILGFFETQKQKDGIKKVWAGDMSVLK